MTRYRFNPPPNWPPVSKGYRPPPGWVAPAEWGPAPQGWSLWVRERSAWAHPAMITAYVVVGLVMVIAVATANVPAPSGAPVTSPTATTSQTPTDGSADEPDDDANEPVDEATSEPPPVEPTAYETLTMRQWKRLTKNPDAHLGEAYLVYGQVTQFDAATGTDMFLADIGPVRDSCSYDICDYPTNTVLTGDEDRLQKAVEDDVFRAKVVVLGSLDYETQIGGETTAPLLQIDRLKILSSP